MTKCVAVCRLTLIAATFAVLLPLTARADDGDGDKVLKWDTMAAVVAPFLAAAGTIDGVPAGGAPWQLTSGKGELRADGRLKVRVRGLVLVNPGTNPFTSFVATVTCLGKVPVQTGLFPTGPEGNADIEEQLDLPSPCFAPAVLVGAPPTAARPFGAWFASTGR
ncbi:MAG: hypothetical protein ACJ79R_21385 [Anaeromyxobacteraceae bacterium]